MDCGNNIDHIVEKAMARDVDMHFDGPNLSEEFGPFPTLLEDFLTNDETFVMWFGDAVYGAQSDMAISAMRPLIEKEDDLELGRYVRNLVMAYIRVSSQEAE